MAKLATPSPLIRTKEVLTILGQNAGNGNGNLGRRLLLGLQKGLIRSQARTAHLSIADHEIRKYNWSIPEWVWQLRTGDLILSEDRFHAVIDEFAPPSQAREGELAGLWKVDLRELKFHKPEMLRNLNISAVSPPSAPVHNKSVFVGNCADWLKAEFGKHPRVTKTKEQFEREAIEQFRGKLGPPGFRAAWKTAVQAFPDRSKPGRPQGT